MVGRTIFGDKIGDNDDGTSERVKAGIDGMMNGSKSWDREARESDDEKGRGVVNGKRE